MQVPCILINELSVHKALETVRRLLYDSRGRVHQDKFHRVMPHHKTLEFREDYLCPILKEEFKIAYYYYFKKFSEISYIS